MKKQLFQTSDSTAALVLRLILSTVIFAHGAQKLLGWYGGYGFTNTMAFFTETVGLPWILGLGVILLEFFGSLALLAGIGTRLVSAGHVLLVLGIVFSTHIQHGFFMNWFGNQAGEGIEYFVLWIGMSLALVILGGGRLSVDQRLASAK